MLTASEFVSGDSTCEGDSGSGAFEQSNFDAGQVGGVRRSLARGASTDGTTCEQPIYTRFDAWGSLIVGAAQQAAKAATAQKARLCAPGLGRRRRPLAEPVPAARRAAVVRGDAGELPFRGLSGE